VALAVALWVVLAVDVVVVVGDVVVNDCDGG
jgi:hypothetical protein